ncbi:hypothetical protein QJQ45_011426 [Haematococcus lacustris]|nr:hypothetical protein QJQ45_011426 [Haematococcus lacustris]
MAAWQLDMMPWQQAELIRHGLLPRPPRPPTPYAITPTSKCQARHVFIDTRDLYGMMRDAGMLGVLTEEGVTSLAKFRNDALLPDPRRQKLASPKHSFAQIVHTDGVALSVMFLRPKPAAPPAEPPRMGKHMGAVNPLAHLDAEWLGVDPGKTNMATVAHEERSAAGTVVSVWQRSLTAGQYYRDSGITRQAQATKKWLAQVKPQLNALSHVSSKPSSLASYRRFADTVLATYDAMWAEVSKPRWANAKFRLYCGKQRVVAGFWSRGVPVSQMLKEALRQFPAGRVLMVDEFRTSRVSSAYSNPNEALPGQPPEAFRWLRPVYSSTKRSRVRGLMCSTSNNIRFYDRDVSAALNIRRCAVGPGPRPTELCYWDGRPAMPKPGQPGQEWVYLRDKALLLCIQPQRFAGWLALTRDVFWSLADTLSDCYRQPGPSAAPVKAMGNKKRGVKASCANAQKAREVVAQLRAAMAEAKAQAVAAEAEAQEQACACESGAQAEAVTAEAEAGAQANAGADEAKAQLHQLQAALQHRERQLADNQRLQQLQQQLQDLQRGELQRKEQQLADLVAQQQAALLQWEQQLIEQQQQLQQQQADLRRREQDLTERHHQLQQQQADLRRREKDLVERQHQLQQQQADLHSREQQLTEHCLLTEQQARIQSLQQQLHRLPQQLEAQNVAAVLVQMSRC